MSYTGRYLLARSRCLHPGQQQGRRWPSSSSSRVRRMRRSRVVSCLASSTQQMNSLRAKGVMSFRHRVSWRWRSAPYAGPRAVYAPPHRVLSGRSQAHGSEPVQARFTIRLWDALPPHGVAGRHLPSRANGHLNDEPGGPGWRGTRAAGAPMRIGRPMGLSWYEPLHQP